MCMWFSNFLENALVSRVKRRMDLMLPDEARLAGKGGGDDGDAKMGLALRPRPCMAGMAVGLVDDLEALGREGRFELAADCLGSVHGRRLGRAKRRCQAAALSGSVSV